MTLDDPKAQQTLRFFITIYYGYCTSRDVTVLLCGACHSAALLLRVLEILDYLVVVALLLRACVHTHTHTHTHTHITCVCVCVCVCVHVQVHVHVHVHVCVCEP
jgi:hypothetical protein